MADRGERPLGPCGRGFWLAAAGIVLAGAVLRLAASMGELWFDEIWNLAFILPVKSAWGVFTEYDHENNHHLISLWMWLCGDKASWWTYRVPSILSGVLGIVVAMRIGLRQSQATAVVAGILFSISYLMVVYSSEARGYGIACCMALVAYDCLEANLTRGTWKSAAGYGLAVVLGMMGSLSFISIAGALGIWASCELYRQQGIKCLPRLIGLQLGPVTALGVFWMVSLRHVTRGVGPDVWLWSIMGETASYVMGLPGYTALGLLLLPGILAFVVWEVNRLRKAGDSRWVVFACGIVVLPALVLMGTGRIYVFPRYFLVNIALLMLMGALVLGRLWDEGQSTRKLCVAAGLAGWALGNGMLDANLCRVGRGHFLDALKFVVNSSNGSNVSIGSVQDSRLQLLTLFYERYLPPQNRPILVQVSDVSTERPPWIISTISHYEGVSLPEQLRPDVGLTYTLVRGFPAIKLSGFEFGVYARSP
jgi:hypothetical protein